MDPSEEKSQDLSDVEEEQQVDDDVVYPAARRAEAEKNKDGDGNSDLFIAALAMVTIFLVALVFLTGDDEPEADDLEEARQMLERAQERSARQTPPPQMQQHQRMQQRQQMQQADPMPSGQRRFEQMQMEHIHRQAAQQMEEQGLVDQPMIRITEEGRQHLEGVEGFEGFEGMEGLQGGAPPQ